MEGGIYGVYGPFGSGKTLISAVMICDKLEKGEIVFSNIKMNTNNIPNAKNYFYFDNFDEFVDILKFSGFFAIEIGKENDKRQKLNLELYPRNQRPKFNVFFDEMGIFANSANFREIHKEYGDEIYDFILQCRKCFMSIYCIAQKPKLIASLLRQHITYWYTYKPLWGSTSLGKHFGYIVLQDLDPDTFAIETIQDMRTDESGNLYNYEIPQQFNMRFIFRRTRYFSCYDDLYMNKKFEVSFKTNYLKDSDFLRRLANNEINNNALIQTKKLYESLLENSMTTVEDNDSYTKAVKTFLYDSCDLFRVYAIRYTPTFVAIYKKLFVRKRNFNKKLD